MNRRSFLASIPFWAPVSKALAKLKPEPQRKGMFLAQFKYYVKPMNEVQYSQFIFHQRDFVGKWNFTQE